MRSTTMTCETTSLRLRRSTARAGIASLTERDLTTEDGRRIEDANAGEEH